MSTRRCECGYRASDDLDLQDHLQESFTPQDGKAPDGSVHDESSVERGCLCGHSASSGDGLDQHFLTVFTTSDRIGLDGRRHAVPGTLFDYMFGFSGITVPENPNIFRK
jgi:hypothetical protein